MLSYLIIAKDKAIKEGSQCLAWLAKWVITVLLPYQCRACVVLKAYPHVVLLILDHVLVGKGTAGVEYCIISNIHKASGTNHWLYLDYYTSLIECLTIK